MDQEKDLVGAELPFKWMKHNELRGETKGSFTAARIRH